MSSFNDDSGAQLLRKLGFIEVGKMHGGVYHFRNDADNTARAEYIGLFYSPVPLTAATKSVQLFMQLVPDLLAVSPLQIQTHWQNLDARRLEESGLHPLVVALPDKLWEDMRPLEFCRPGESSRVRHCIQLPTLDIVCYN